MNEVLLSLEKVNFRIGKKNILNDLSLQLQTGKSLAVVGHNGAGKTTLFHLMLGLKFVTAGEIKIMGKPAHSPKARLKLGYVSERPYLNDQLTLVETLQYFAKLSRMTEAQMMFMLEEVVKKVGLLHAKNQKLKTFSKGMLQRTLLAQALMTSPELLILDEPMSGLDPEGREFVRSLMIDLKKQGKSMIFSTHALEEVAVLADEVLVLDQGVSRFQGGVSEWRAQK